MTYDRAVIITGMILQRKRRRFFKENDITATLHFNQEDWQYIIETCNQKHILNSTQEVLNWLINNGFIDNETGNLRMVEL